MDCAAAKTMSEVKIDEASKTAFLAQMKEYCAKRQLTAGTDGASQQVSVELAAFFTPETGYLVDMDAKTHTGALALSAYFRQPSPVPSKVLDPKLLEDGRGLIDIEVPTLGGWKTVTVHVHVAFNANKKTFDSIVLSRDKVFGMF